MARRSAIYLSQRQVPSLSITEGLRMVCSTVIIVQNPGSDGIGGLSTRES